MELLDEENEEEKGEQKDTNNNKEDQLRVNNIKHKVKSIDEFLCRIWLLQKPSSIEKRT